MAGPSKRSWNSLITLSGCIVPKEQLANTPTVEDDGEDSGSDDDEDGDMQWLDMNEIDDANAGVSVAAPKRLSNKLVHVMDKSGRIHRVKGRFPLDDPWWDFSVECRQSGGNMLFTTGYPEYRLNENPSKDLIFLFLKACNVKEDFRKAFHDALQTEPQLQGTQLNFQNLGEVLEQYGSINETTEAVSRDMLGSIQYEVAGEEVTRALLAPTFLRYGPKLLPKRFYSLLKVEEDKPDKLKILEEVTAQEPWKLGFSPIMYWEYNLIGCEATLDAFKHCNLLETFPVTVKDALYIYDFIKSKCRREGHTFLYEKILHRRSIRDRDIVDRVKAMKFLEDNKVTVQLEGKVSLKRYYDYECNIKRGIETLLTPRMGRHDFVIEPEGLEGVFGDDEDQKKAAELICRNPVTVLSGKGGCGKTYVVSKVFQVAHRQLLEEAAAKYEEEKYLNETLNSSSDSLLDEENSQKNQEGTACEDKSKKSTISSAKQPSVHGKQDRPARGHESDGEDDSDNSIGQILLTAPTGKAAHLLGKRTGLEAKTLHQVIWSYRHNKGNPCGWAYRDVRALVVDESSLVSIQTFSTLFSILLKHSCLQKLVLLGDIDQLPSIDPGNFLTDIYHALAPIGWSIKLRTNHRSESKLIVDNATLISQQRLPEFDQERHFHKVRVDREEMLSKAVKDLLKNGCAGNHETSQFVAFRRKDCNIINEVCCQWYSGHSMKNNKKETWFMVGDKVCCTKNANVNVFSDPKPHADKEVEPQDSKDTQPSTDKEVKQQKKSKSKVETVRLCNGEIFFIREDLTVQDAKGRSTRYLMLDDLDRQIKVDYREVKLKGGLKHAWARTIHTYQGSESDTVVYVVGTPTRHQNWQHVYTAVTRGKKEVFVVTSSDALSRSVQTLPIFRNTHLRRFLEKLLSPERPPTVQGMGHAKLQARSFVTALDLCKGKDSGAGPSTAGTDGDMGWFTAISEPGTILGEVTKRAKAVETDSPFISPIAAKRRRASSEKHGRETPSNNSMNSSTPWSDWGDSFVDEVLEAEVRLSQQHTGQSSSSLVAEPCDVSSANNFVDLDDQEFTDSEMWRIGEEKEENITTTVDHAVTEQCNHSSASGLVELDDEEFTDSEMWRIGEEEEGKVVTTVARPVAELHEERKCNEEPNTERAVLENQENGLAGDNSPDMFAAAGDEEIPYSGLETTGEVNCSVEVIPFQLKGGEISTGNYGSPEIPIITIPKCSRLTRIKDLPSRKLFGDSGKEEANTIQIQSKSSDLLPSSAVPQGITRGAAEQVSQPTVSPPRLPSAGVNNMTSPKRSLSDEDRTLTPGTPTKIQRSEACRTLQSPPTSNLSLSQLNLQSPTRPSSF